jgi:tetratricopeptide (TPR) repeat protein
MARNKLNFKSESDFEMVTAKQIIDQAIDLSDAGNYHKAYSLFTQAIKLDRFSAQAYFERAMVLMNMDRVVEALVDFDECLKLNPRFPGARDWRARALETTGKLDSAAQERLQSLRDNPDGPHEGVGVSPQAWADCAEAFARAGDSKRAIALLEEYLAMHSKKVTSYARFETAPLRILARLMIQVGATDRAVVLARSAYSNIKHRCPMDFVVYGLALEADGEKEEALKIAEEALRENDQLEEAIELKLRLTNNSKRSK